MRFRLRVTQLVACLLAVSAPSLAHLFYLQERPSRIAGMDRLVVDVRVGHAFVGELLPRLDHHIDRFVVFDADGSTTELLGVDGRVPAGVAAGFEGPGLVLYESRGVAQQLERSKFEKYATEEGVSHLLESRPPDPGGMESELFHRCAKAAVGNRDASWSIAAMPTGCNLEIVTVDQGPQPRASRLAFRVLLRGQALPLALLRLNIKGQPEALARTDEDGVATFDIGIEAAESEILVSAVHIEALDPQSDQGWRSWWASLALSGSERRLGSIAGTSD